MAHKPKTTDKITAKFNVKTLPKIEGEPDYEGINEMMQLLYSNTATLPTPQGGGHHRHICIIMKPTLYTTLTTTAWKNPPDPGVHPTIPTNATAALRDQLQLQHDEGRRIYENTGTMDEALKNQFIDAVEDTHLKELKIGGPYQPKLYFG